MIIAELLKEHLKEKGFDGLACNTEECYCYLDDIVQCGDLDADCSAGYARVLPIRKISIHKAPEGARGEGMNSVDMIKEYLIENGFNGIMNSDHGCDCLVSNLAPCGKSINDCQSGFKMLEGDGWRIITEAPA